MITFKQTIQFIRADYQRKIDFENENLGLLRKLLMFFDPAMVSVIMYRLSRFCIHNHMSIVCRLLVVIEHLYSRNEISPLASIGPGLVLSGMGIGISANVTIGKNCTLLGRNTLALGGMPRFDPHRHYIIIGDNCILGVGTRVIRPVYLESGIQIMTNSVVMSNEHRAGSVLSGIPARHKRVETLIAIKHWNPLLGKPISQRHAS